jgi:hypothetical protein
MKAILKFNLDDADDRMAHLRAVQSTELAIALWHIMYNSKKKLQELYEEDLDSIWEAFNDILIENNINLDKLII